MDEEKVETEAQIEPTEEENNESENEDVDNEVIEDITNAHINIDMTEVLEALNKIETTISKFNEKLDNMISMSIDSGAIINDRFDSNEEPASNYAEDFIDIDNMDLSI